MRGIELADAIDDPAVTEARAIALARATGLSAAESERAATDAGLVVLLVVLRATGEQSAAAKLALAIATSPDAHPEARRVVRVLAPEVFE